MRIIDGDGHIMEQPNDIWTADRIDHDRSGARVLAGGGRRRDLRDRVHGQRRGG